MKVERECFEKSQQLYSMDPVKRAQYEEEIAKICAELRTNDVKKMTKETIIDAVKRLE